VQVSLEPLEILAVGVIAVAVVATLLLTSLERVQRQLGLDKRSLLILRVFCGLEAALVLFSPFLSFPGFTVLHQLLLAYPGSVFFKIVASIVFGPKDTDRPFLPHHRHILENEVTFLRELDQKQDMLHPKLKKTKDLLGTFKTSVNKCPLTKKTRGPINNIRAQIGGLQTEVNDVIQTLGAMKTSARKRSTSRNEILQQV
jgi:hypothetical protein